MITAALEGAAQVAKKKGNSRQRDKQDRQNRGRKVNRVHR